MPGAVAFKRYSLIYFFFHFLIQCKKRRYDTDNNQVIILTFIATKITIIAQGNMNQRNRRKKIRWGKKR